MRYGVEHGRGTIESGKWKPKKKQFFRSTRVDTFEHPREEPKGLTKWRSVGIQLSDLQAMGRRVGGGPNSGISSRKKDCRNPPQENRCDREWHAFACLVL